MSAQAAMVSATADRLACRGMTFLLGTMREITSETASSAGQRPASGKHPIVGG
jgi:hypothetical protein